MINKRKKVIGIIILLLSFIFLTKLIEKQSTYNECNQVLVTILKIKTHNTPKRKYDTLWFLYKNEEHIINIYSDLSDTLKVNDKIYLKHKEGTNIFVPNDGYERKFILEYISIFIILALSLYLIIKK